MINQITKRVLLIMFMLSATACLATTQARQQDNSDVRTIEIIGTDQMKYDVTTIEAAPGEKIRVVLTTVSDIPKQAMAHNVVFLKPEAMVKEFINASARAKDNNYIAPEMGEFIIAKTEMAGGGETVEVTFTVPQDAGEYEYVCTFPGHYYGGMKGVLVVK